MPKKTDIPVKPVLFQIEVPKDQRKTFWTRPKSKLEYWAFKNRPRAFFNEKVIFTFDNKPVAETVILLIEGPGKGEGQYKHWHKVYWNPMHFRRYKGKTSANKWIGPVYHGTDVPFAGKPKGHSEAAGFTYFTDDAQYADKFTGAGGRYTEHSRIYPAYIRFNKPFDAREIDDLDKEGFADAIGADEDLPIAMYGEKWQPFWRWVLINPDITKHYLKKQGYDGIIQLEALDLGQTPNTTSFITFNDNQIRSMTAEPKPKKLMDLRTGAIQNENFGRWGVTEPDVMYHISRRTNRGSIRSQGLVPQVREFKDVKRSPANYLFESPIAAKEWAFYHAQYVNQPCDIWEVTLPVDTKLFWDTHPDMDGFDAWFTTATIPPENLKVVGTVLIPTSKSPSPEKYEGKGWKTSAAIPQSNYLIWMSHAGRNYVEDQEVAWSHDSWAEELGFVIDKRTKKGYAVIDPEERTVEMQSYGEFAPESVVQSIKAKYPMLKKFKFGDKKPYPYKFSSKTADQVLDVGDGDEYWAGEGNAASGILPICPQTGNVCLAWRSKYVMSPDCWGTIGGAVQEGMSPQQSAKAELKEETGYAGGMTLIPAYVFTDRGFSYHNFIGVVSSEFSFAPKPLSKQEYAALKARLHPNQYYQLNPGWETDHIVWIPYQQWVDDMTQNSGDYHPGVLKLYHDSKDKIEKALKIQPQAEQQKTSADKAKLTEFMKDLWANTYGNPFNNAERVWQDKAIIECRPFDGRIHLSLIRSVEKGKGGGTEGLKFLTALADKHGVEIDLGAKPVGKDGLNKSQLVQWYKRHGFNPRRGETSDSLLYAPKETLKLNGPMKTIPMEKSSAAIEYKDEMRGAHSGQSDMTLRAYVNGQTVGYVDYAVFQDQPSIQYIEVTDKRKGYGTALLRKLQTMYPDAEIDLGMTTPDGTGLIDSLTWKEEPTEVAEQMAELEKLVPERDRLQAMADEFYDQENHTDEEKQAFMAEMEKLNVIHDRVWELEQATNGKSPKKRLIAAKCSPEVIDKLVAMHDKIKELPGRLRVSQPAVAESVAEIQQPALEGLMKAIARDIPHASKGHLGQAQRALENAEIAYHDYRNSTELDTPEKIEVALNEQETALIILHQILKEEARKIGKTASAELPPEPGTAPIPAGTVRLYHYTKSRESFENIKREGLKASYAKGDDGSGQGPSAGMWASTRTPGDQHLFVELYLTPEQISHRADYPRPEDNPEEWAKGYHHVIANGDVPLNQIVAFHEPWHKHARYLMEPGTWDELMERDPQIVDAASDGSAFSKAPDGEAVRWMAANFGTGKTAGMKIALNIPRLVKDFGKKLVQRYWQHHPYPEDRQQMAQITPEVIINQIASQDVTPNKEYTAWITGNYARGDIARFEDIAARVIPALKRFHALKAGRRIPNDERDIGRIKGLQQLEDLVAKYGEVDATSKRQQDASQEQQFFTDGSAQLVLNNDKYKIVIPKTQEASCYFGINTRWCTAATKGNMFNTYAKDGPLYIVLVKANNERYQFHFESGQFMDERDEQIDPDAFFDQYPDLAPIFLPLAEGVLERAEAHCDQCNGMGKISCDSCDDGKIKCQFCGGEEDLECPDCEGAGQVDNADGTPEEPEYVDCPTCGGVGTKPCPECDGTGGSRCEECKGSAFLYCDACDGTGQNDVTVKFRDAAFGSKVLQNQLGQGTTASKIATKFYHGGGDVQGGMLDVRKGQSGAIFVTPDINYAKQYVKTNGGGLYTVDVDESKIFDPENPDHLEQLAQGYLNLIGEDYSEEEDAMSDYHHFVSQSPEMMMDWAVAPDAFDAVRSLGYKGMKLRERPGTVSIADDGFNISGPPITSIALFDNKVPATRIASDWTKKAAGFAFKTFPKLWHVGSMKKRDKQPGSLEGSGLSVSVHPEDWMAIAEIGGDTWELTKPGNKFLNFHRLSKAQRQQIAAWGIQNGYLTEVANAFRFTYYDVEAEEERYMEFPTKEEAEAEMEGMGEEGQITPVSAIAYAGTDKLKQRTNNPHGDQTAVAFDLLVTVYVEEELDCDGVWWEDTYDPLNLSAPRGVIFPSKLQTWKAKKIQQAKTGSDLSYYMTEGCGMFAVALCEFHPKSDIKCISNPNGEAWSESIPFELSHVYCSTPSGNYDVNGEHSVESMASSLHMSNYRVIGGWSPKEFASKFMGMGDAFPLYGDPADVEEARQIILANPQKYGVKQEKTAAEPAKAPAPGLVLQPGTKLYRGIGEDVIDTHAPAADGCLWTTESITIARSYIPASGLSLLTTLEGICGAPQERGGMEGLQKQLGFEYTDIKYDETGRANSYRLPKLLDTLVPEPHPDEKQFKTKNEYWDASHAWQEKRKKALENYVKQKLGEYGYEPEKSSFGGGRYDLMVDWQNGQNVLLPNKFQEGTVCVFEVIQPLNIYDMTEGGKVQGDLLNPQYREYGKFGTIAAAGYDGVKIDDYAQVEGHGNVGHTSIGIFKNGVPKIKEIERVKATHPEDLYADLKKYGAGK